MNPTRRIYRLISILVILALLQFAPQAKRIDSNSDNGLDGQADSLPYSF